MKALFSDIIHTAKSSFWGCICPHGKANLTRKTLGNLEIVKLLFNTKTSKSHDQIIRFLYMHLMTPGTFNLAQTKK